MMKRLILIMCLIGIIIPINQAFSCSNVFFHGDNGIAAVGRTRDYASNPGCPFVVGKRGEENKSYINMPQNGAVDPLTWTTKYNFLGQSGYAGGYFILDGINTEGLYAAFLDLPNVTKYPEYKKNGKKEIGFIDLGNYILGTCRTTAEAKEKLEQVQIVAQAAYGTNGFVGTPMHFVVRDKTGHSLVAEWVDGKTNIYDPAGPVLTNSPIYPWQNENFEKNYATLFSGNTARKWDNLYMNGSGMASHDINDPNPAGLPGDWTSPSRFVRLSALVKVMPKPKTQQEAMYSALMAINQVTVPIAANPEPTLWQTLINLKDGKYYFMPFIYNTYTDPDNKTDIKVEFDSRFDVKWQVWDVNDIESHINSLPGEYGSAKVWPIEKAGKELLVNSDDVQNIIGKNGIGDPTPGPTKYNFDWINLALISKQNLEQKSGNKSEQIIKEIDVEVFKTNQKSRKH